MQDLSLLKILNRVQILSTRYVYNYNKMERINNKPALQAGQEVLLEYNVNLPLHIQFCNPKEVMKLIQEKAVSRESFAWMFNDEYMGSFVIDSVEINRQNQVKDFIIYAELNINLLENPDVNEEENTNIPNIPEDMQYSESSNKFKDFINKAKESIKTRTKEAVEAIVTGNATISDNLTDAGKELFGTISADVLGDLSGKNVTEMYGKVSNWVTRVNENTTLSPNEVIALTTAVKSIPQAVIKTGLRG